MQEKDKSYDYCPPFANGNRFNQSYSNKNEYSGRPYSGGYNSSGGGQGQSGYYDSDTARSKYSSEYYRRDSRPYPVQRYDKGYSRGCEDGYAREYRGHKSEESSGYDYGKRQPYYDDGYKYQSRPRPYYPSERISDRPNERGYYDYTKKYKYDERYKYDNRFEDKSERKSVEPYYKPYDRGYEKPYYERSYDKPYDKPYERPYEKQYDKPYARSFENTYDSGEKPFVKKYKYDNFKSYEYKNDDRGINYYKKPYYKEKSYENYEKPAYRYENDEREYDERDEEQYQGDNEKMNDENGIKEESKMEEGECLSSEPKDDDLKEDLKDDMKEDLKEQEERMEVNFDKGKEKEEEESIGKSGEKIEIVDKEKIQSSEEILKRMDEIDVQVCELEKRIQILKGEMNDFDSNFLVESILNSNKKISKSIKEENEKEFPTLINFEEYSQPVIEKFQNQTKDLLMRVIKRRKQQTFELKKQLKVKYKNIQNEFQSKLLENSSLFNTSYDKLMGIKNGFIHSKIKVDNFISQNQSSKDIQLMFVRTIAKIPNMLLDGCEKAFPFISENGLVSDPMNVYQQSKYINPWSDDEKDKFVSAFLEYPKNFSKIASFIENKSSSDCVKFYYLNKKSLDLKKLSKKKFRKIGPGSSRELKDLTLANLHWEQREHREKSKEKEIKTPIKSNSKEINTKDTPSEPSTPIENNTNTASRWTVMEKVKAIEGIRFHGKNFQKISEYVGTKTEQQCRSFYQNYKKKLDLDTIIKNNEKIIPKVETPSDLSFEKVNERKQIPSTSIPRPLTQTSFVPSSASYLQQPLGYPMPFLYYPNSFQFRFPPMRPPFFESNFNRPIQQQTRRHSITSDIVSNSFNKERRSSGGSIDHSRILDDSKLQLKDDKVKLKLQDEFKKEETVLTHNDSKLQLIDHQPMVSLDPHNTIETNINNHSETFIPQEQSTVPENIQTSETSDETSKNDETQNL
ncbi:hypothetical protein ROZALSC1DRAFT_27681 [Rozella allomycis CSF55]|uniref:SANT/Myb domain-containing protein n=1 Tax=Rozella allomycis (strain CSF55) TaxID=988480 RepID=A0A4P9YN09_ROZAC|nr:hypothetical protein ROZALSC1DRAFT_27681 [Rozella allomycis CSF55]